MPAHRFARPPGLGLGSLSIALIIFFSFTIPRGLPAQLCFQRGDTAQGRRLIASPDVSLKLTATGASATSERRDGGKVVSRNATRLSWAAPPSRLCLGQRVSLILVGEGNYWLDSHYYAVGAPGTGAERDDPYRQDYRLPASGSPQLKDYFTYDVTPPLPYEGTQIQVRTIGLPPGPVQVRYFLPVDSAPPLRLAATDSFRVAVRFKHPSAEMAAEVSWLYRRVGAGSAHEEVLQPRARERLVHRLEEAERQAEARRTNPKSRASWILRYFVRDGRLSAGLAGLDDAVFEKAMLMLQDTISLPNRLRRIRDLFYEQANLDVVIGEVYQGWSRNTSFIAPLDAQVAGGIYRRETAKEALRMADAWMTRGETEEGRTRATLFLLANQNQWTPRRLVNDVLLARLPALAKLKAGALSVGADSRAGSATGPTGPEEEFADRAADSYRQARSVIGALSSMELADAQRLETFLDRAEQSGDFAARAAGIRQTDPAAALKDVKAILEAAGEAGKAAAKQVGTVLDWMERFEQAAKEGKEIGLNQRYQATYELYADSRGAMRADLEFTRDSTRKLADQLSQAILDHEAEISRYKKRLQFDYNREGMDPETPLFCIGKPGPCEIQQAELAREIGRRRLAVMDLAVQRRPLLLSAHLLDRRLAQLP